MSSTRDSRQCSVHLARLERLLIIQALRGGMDTFHMPAVGYEEPLPFPSWLSLLHIKWKQHKMKMSLVPSSSGNSLVILREHPWPPPRPLRGSKAPFGLQTGVFQPFFQVNVLLLLLGLGFAYFLLAQFGCLKMHLV